MSKKMKKYQEQLKKWQQQTEKQSENSIKRFYRKLIRDVLAEIGAIYAKYEKGGVLTYEEMAKFDRITKFLDSLQAHVNQLSKQTKDSIEGALRDSYEYSYYWMGYAVETAAAASIGVAALTKDVVSKAVDNPIRGLTLSETLEKNRVDIVYNIQQNVKRGLTQGMTYKQMADDLKEHLEKDEKKAATALAGFEKVAKTYPYPHEIAGEREMIAYAETKLAE